MKKKDEKENMDEMHKTQGGAKDQKVRKEVRVSCTKSSSLQHGGEERRSWRMKKRMRDCWTVVKRTGKNEQNIGSVAKMCRMWRIS